MNPCRVYSPKNFHKISHTNLWNDLSMGRCKISNCYHDFTSFEACLIVCSVYDCADCLIYSNINNLQLYRFLNLSIVLHLLNKYRYSILNNKYSYS